MTKGPNLEAVRHRIHYISLVRRFDSREANAVMPAPDQRDVFGVRPAERHRRTGWTTGLHSCLGQVWSIPNLFGEHAALVRKIFDRRDKRFWIATGSELVVAAFSRQNRPAPAHSSSIVSAPVSFLAVAVMIVAAPARALRQIVLLNPIDHFNRVKHQRIVWSSNAIAHKMKEIATHDVSRRMQATAVGDLYHLCVGIGMRIRFVRIGGIDADVVTRNAFD